MQHSMLRFWGQLVMRSAQVRPNNSFKADGFAAA